MRFLSDRFLPVLVLLIAVVLLSPLASRGDDPSPGCERKVKVALALAAAKEKAPAAKPAPKPAKRDKVGVARPVKLDWLISAESKVEEAPAPRAAGPAPCDAAANKPAKGGPAKADAAPGSGRLVMAPTPYKEVRAKVEDGELVLMMVRPPAGHTCPARVGYTTLRCDDAPVAAGLYDCRLVQGKKPYTSEAVMELRESWEKPMPPAAGVPAPHPFTAHPFTATPTTSATGAAGFSTRWPASTPTGLIRIGVPGAATFGGTSGTSGCPARG